MRLQRNEEEAVKRLHGTRAKRLWQRDEMVCQHCPDKLLEQHVPQSESVLYLVLAFLSLIRLIIWQIVLSIWKMTLALMPTDQSWTWRLVSHFNL